MQVSFNPVQSANYVQRTNEVKNGSNAQNPSFGLINRALVREARKEFKAFGFLDHEWFYKHILRKKESGEMTTRDTNDTINRLVDLGIVHASNRNYYGNTMSRMA